MKEITFDVPTPSFADDAPLPAEDGFEPVESTGPVPPGKQVGLSVYVRNDEGKFVFDESCHVLARELYYSQRVAYDEADSRRMIGRYNADGTVTPLAVQYNVQSVEK
jgi:RNase adaptor protein for sRNA GlmZ degradation